MRKYILSIFTLILILTTVSAQEQTVTATNDTTPALTKKELRKQRVARRNFHYNILGGPSYTPDFGALIGGSALMTFRMNPSDTTQLRSVLPMSIAYMFKGGVNLMVKPQLFFKGDRFRSSESLSTRIRKTTSTASVTARTKITSEATVPANTVTAAYKSTRGFCSAWEKATSLPARR